jgi:hypothetical protein
LADKKVCHIFVKQNTTIMKTLKLILSTLLVLVGLNVWGQSPSDPVTDSTFNQEYFDSLVFVKMVDIAPDYGITLVRDTLMDSVSTYILDNSSKVQKLNTDDDGYKYIVFDYIYNNPNKIAVTGGEYYLILDGRFTYERYTTTKAKILVENIIDNDSVQEGDTILFSYGMDTYNHINESCDNTMFVTYITER